ncbi:hypothetical protein HAX54_004897, partial [Datura stramonium]|nr:hypothetical protein [Datura stramonium]
MSVLTGGRKFIAGRAKRRMRRRSGFKASGHYLVLALHRLGSAKRLCSTDRVSLCPVVYPGQHLSCDSR